MGRCRCNERTERGTAGINDLLARLADFTKGVTPVEPDDIDQENKATELADDIVADEWPERNGMISVIYTNTTGEERTVTIPAARYRTPDGQDIVLAVPISGYAEASFLNINGVVYARGC